MSIKKKLGLGVASAALGLSLIGGGTWAAFNDVETMQNRVQAGVLNLEIGNKVTGEMKVKKLIPGDTMTREFTLQNQGNLNIPDVWLTVDPADETIPGFYGELAVTILNSDNQNKLAGITPTGVRDDNTKYVSMQDLIDYANNNKFDISSDNLNNGDKDFDGRDADTIKIKVEFVDKKADTDGDGEYDQNKYQNAVAEFNFNFEAVQEAGSERANN
ncbi:TasA family protein [Bacillus sp. DTU_2020_1000418_1_SI_GHA_SEK_038]|uniref:TasA family protein n=1 Tax=Bacillus sp. DTU_2020_1000418_1_SI_GHA_SEK_038 TaxID=3077585 RepID=UPI0028E23DAF|nr:TasA family protein [Bacillus sp. DTU_2020_1000418_1_SI_GHA_SEK_038]WNS76386.1 TasA family protein [Bacillus sp. DTU_2020_1000418_1_SI_GHA_SEK_038]